MGILCWEDQYINYTCKRHLLYLGWPNHCLYKPVNLQAKKGSYTVSSCTRLCIWAVNLSFEEILNSLSQISSLCTPDRHFCLSALAGKMRWVCKNCNCCPFDGFLRNSFHFQAGFFSAKSDSRDCPPYQKKYAIILKCVVNISFFAWYMTLLGCHHSQYGHLCFIQGLLSVVFFFCHIQYFHNCYEKEIFNSPTISFPLPGWTFFLLNWFLITLLHILKSSIYWILFFDFNYIYQYPGGTDKSAEQSLFYHRTMLFFSCRCNDERF